MKEVVFFIKANRNVSIPASKKKKRVPITLLISRGLRKNPQSHKDPFENSAYVIVIKDA